MAVSQCNPANLYVSVQSFDTAVGGVFRSTNAGASWSRVARVKPNYTGVDHLDNPVRVRVDPNNSLRVYAADGVRGGTQGFWVSTDGGESFVQPDGFANLSQTIPGGLFQFDVYDIAVDPADFNHVLLSFHSAWGWTDSKWNTNSGVLESNDGGTTWIVHEPMPGWGSGHAISFLYRPDLKIGDRNTWLLGTQGSGMWRTTDAGKSWALATPSVIQHGGGNVYYDKAGVLYASASPHNLRSTDNGAHWNEIGPFGGFNTILGDGKVLYAHALFQTGPFMTSPEGGAGTTWTPIGTHQFTDGSYELALDPINGILYSSTWGLGVWAIKVAPR